MDLPTAKLCKESVVAWRPDTSGRIIPTVIEQQAERLRTARQAAAQGMLSSYTIPLLADTQTLLNKGKLSWTLKFPLPLPAERPANRRFSSLQLLQPRKHSPLRHSLSRAPGPYRTIWRNSPGQARLPSTSRHCQLAAQRSSSHLWQVWPQPSWLPTHPNSISVGALLLQRTRPPTSSFSSGELQRPHSGRTWRCRGGIPQS